MIVLPPLSEKRAEYLRDILDLWISGHEGATQDVIQDRTIEEPEQMLELIDGMHDQLKEACDLRDLLNHELGVVS